MSGKTENSQDYIKLKSSDGTETIHYPFLIKTIPAEFEHLLYEELKETEEKKKIGLKKLKDVIEKEKLRCIKEEMLLMFLRTSKYDLKRAEKKVKNYAIERQKLAKNLSKISKERIMKAIDDAFISFHPYRGADGRGYCFGRSPGVDEYEENELTSIIKAFLMFVGSIPLNAVTGFVYMSECKNTSLYSQYIIMKYFYSFIKCALCIPIRVPKLEVLNEMFYCHACYQALRPFIPERLFKRVEFNGQSYSKLHSKYDKKLLFEEFEGTRGPINSEFYRTEFYEYIENLVAEYKGES